MLSFDMQGCYGFAKESINNQITKKSAGNYTLGLVESWKCPVCIEFKLNISIFCTLKPLFHKGFRFLVVVIFIFKSIVFLIETMFNNFMFCKN